MEFNRNVADSLPGTAAPMGHGAFPHHGNDPVIAAGAVINAYQTVAARRTDPLDSTVVSITRFHAGHTTNVIAEEAIPSGTTRALKPETQDMIERELRQIPEGVGVTYGVGIEFSYDRRYLPTVNTEIETEKAAAAAAAIVVAENILRDEAPI